MRHDRGPAAPGDVESGGRDGGEPEAAPLGDSPWPPLIAWREEAGWLAAEGF